MDLYSGSERRDYTMSRARSIAVERGWDLKTAALETIWDLETSRKGGMLNSRKLIRIFEGRIAFNMGGSGDANSTKPTRPKGFSKGTYAAHQHSWSRQTNIGNSINDIRRGMNIRRLNQGSAGKNHVLITSIQSLNWQLYCYDEKHGEGASEVRALWHLWTDYNQKTGEFILKEWIESAIENEGGVVWKHGRPELLSKNGGKWIQRGQHEGRCWWAGLQVNWVGHAAQGHWKLGFENRWSNNTDSLHIGSSGWADVVQVVEDDNNPSGFRLIITTTNDRLAFEHARRYKNTFEVMTTGAAERGFLICSNHSDTRNHIFTHQLMNSKQCPLWGLPSKSKSNRKQRTTRKQQGNRRSNGRRHQATANPVGGTRGKVWSDGFTPNLSPALNRAQWAADPFSRPQDNGELDRQTSRYEEHNA